MNDLVHFSSISRSFDTPPTQFHLHHPITANCTTPLLPLDDFPSHLGTIRLSNRQGITDTTSDTVLLLGSLELFGFLLGGRLQFRVG